MLLRLEAAPLGVAGLRAARHVVGAHDLDYQQLVGLSQWPETQEELDALLPPPSGLMRSKARLIRLLL